MLIRSISGRLLLLTVAFVMLAEVLIFLPSVAAFRHNYLSERLERAQIASLALLAADGDMVDDDLGEELLKTAEVLNIVMRRDEARELIIASPMPKPIDATYDLRGAGRWSMLRDTLDTLAAPADRVIRIIGLPVHGGGVAIEATLEERNLRAAMFDYGLRVLGLSLAISIITAVLIAVSLRLFLVRPMTRFISNMRSFAEDPEDPERVIRPASRITEIAEAEVALEKLEIETRQALRQRARLAALGEALAKVSHDLRNLLFTAQLLADRLEGSADPRVSRVTPKIIRSLDRAVALCVSTLNYGRVEEPEPVIRNVALRALVEEVGESVFPEREDPGGAEPGHPGAPRFVNAAPEDMTLPADPDQLHRILLNLARNARQAMETAGRSGEIRIEARASEGWTEIDVVDHGPGLPEKARANLFTPFKGGVAQGGAGLGLAIAAELARAHGGDVSLETSTTEGARFRVRLPRRPRPTLVASRGEGGEGGGGREDAA